MAGCSHSPSALRPQFPARDYVTGDEFIVATCAVCGLTVTTPTPSDDQSARYYPAEYYGSATESRFVRGVEWMQRKLYTSRARSVQRLNGGRIGRVVDVGCGRGDLLAAFRRLGWEVEGTELSEAAARPAREKHQLDVHCGRLQDLCFDDDTCDAVVLWHVLEHVPKPQDLLQEVSRILRPAGEFLVAVPDFGSPEARLARDKWFHLDVPRHVNHFTRDVMRRMLNEAGLQIERSSGFALEYDLFSFVQSGLNRMGLRHNLLYEMLRGRGAKLLTAKRTSRSQVLLTLLLVPWLAVAGIPLTMIAGFLGHGATMTFYARKSPAHKTR